MFNYNSILLTLSISALKLMLDIVYEYGEEYDVIFNPDKYKLLCYSNGSTCVNSIEVNDIKVPAEQITDHLGNSVGPDER